MSVNNYLYILKCEKIKHNACGENEFNYAYISMGDESNGPNIISRHHPVDISIAVPVIMDKLSLNVSADVCPSKLIGADWRIYASVNEPS